MDRMIYTAMTALSGMRDDRITQAQNLANQNVPGFRRDLDNGGGTAFAEVLGGMTARAFHVEAGPAGFSAEPGPMTPTGQDMDIAISDAGWFYIRPENGEPALSRRGDLRQDADGFLRDGSGAEILDTNLQPIKLAPHKSVIVNELGEIWIEPVNGEPGIRQLAATIATVQTPDDLVLQKGQDGHIRVPDGDLPPPDQTAKVVQGYLEGSNVNTVDELIASIDMQRDFEFGIKLVTTAKELDEASSALMRVAD